MKFYRRLYGFRKWLEAQDLAERTIKEYLAALSLFFEDGRDFTQTDLREYKSKIKTLLAPTTVNARIAAFNKYADYKKKEGCHLDPIKIPIKLYVESCLTMRQYNKLLNGLIEDGNMQGYAEVRLLACTGLRASEVIKVTIKDLQNGSMDILGKGTKVRTVWFPKSMRQDILKALSDRSPDERVIKCAVRTLGSHLASYSERYGIPRDVMHPHEFRKFFARNFNISKNNIAFLQAILGHSNINTTARYMKRTRSEIAIKISKTVKW